MRLSLGNLVVGIDDLRTYSVLPTSNEALIRRTDLYATKAD